MASRQFYMGSARATLSALAGANEARGEAAGGWGRCCLPLASRDEPFGCHEAALMSVYFLALDRISHFVRQLSVKDLAAWALIMNLFAVLLHRRFVDRNGRLAIRQQDVIGNWRPLQRPPGLISGGIPPSPSLANSVLA